MKGKPGATKQDQLLGLAVLAATSEPPHTQQTLADYMGITRQRVDQIEKRALRKMRIRLCQHLGVKIDSVKLSQLLRIK